MFHLYCALLLRSCYLNFLLPQGYVLESFSEKAKLQYHS